MDFDDLLVNMVVLFNSHTDLLHKYQHKYRYLMIDEYQDTNHAQYLIAKKLAAVHENIVVVGDDSQSIYSFRGATIENILNFSKDYPDAKTYKLEQNYRSTSTIVEAANSVIDNNVDRLPKNIFSLKEGGDLIELIVGESEVQEAEKVVDSIREQKLRRNLDNNAFAILYRTNAQSRTLEDALRRASIPYKIFGGMSFYRRKEIKDAVAYLRLALNPYDEESLKRVINYPVRGIGNTTMDQLLGAAYQHNLRLWDVILGSDKYLTSRSWSAVNGFAALVKSFQNAAFEPSAYVAAEFIIRASGMLKDLHQPEDLEMMDRYENVMEFLDGVKEFSDNPDNEIRNLPAFLNEIALYTDADKDDESDDYVSMMTVHASKGLEFHSVFVVGLEEGLFPSSMSLYSREGLEEERRLCYVAMTRAKEKLTLSYAKRRLRYGNLEFTEPSRFLKEVDPKYIGTKTRAVAEKKPAIPVEPPRNLTALKPVTPPSPATAGAAVNTPDVAVGHTVEHDRFGRGIVVKLDGPTEDRRAVVNFPGKGEKTLLLRYAKLVVVQ
jgi:DNA helicase-2/ATP-dependent DNA helicase PcrA